MQAEPKEQARASHSRLGPQKSLSSLFDDEAKEADAPDKDALARAFMEEAKALAEGGVDEADLESNLAEPQPDKFNYYGDVTDASAKPLGFGSLLGSKQEDDDAKPSALAHLMTPTGQQTTHFAPERQTEEAAFDEPEVSSSEPIRLNESKEAPSFSALFSNEIVTTGQDYSVGFQSGNSAFESQSEAAGSFDDGISESAQGSYGQSVEDVLNPGNEYAGEPSSNWQDNPQGYASMEPSQPSFTGMNSEEAAPLDEKPKSLVISKLLEGLNKSKEESKPASAPEPAESALAPAPEVPVANQEQAEVARILAELEAPRVDDKEVSLDELKSLLKKEKQAKKEAEKKKQEEEARAQEMAAAAAAAASSPEVQPEPVVEKKGFDYEGFDDRPISEKLAEARKKEEAKARGEEDSDEGSTLGDAVADALDKLLAGDGEDAGAGSGTGAGTGAGLGMAAAAGAGMGLGMAAMAFSGAGSAEEKLEEKIVAASENTMEADPMTLTQSKVDALSRLLEVASKAPDKVLEEPKRPTDSASKLAEMINKPQGKVSRQMEALEGETAPSNYTSPFSGPSSSMTNQPSFNRGPEAVPQAPISTDAVSARIAALNRKLEEQSKPPSATFSGQRAQPASSAYNMPATMPPGQSPGMGGDSYGGYGAPGSSSSSLSSMPGNVAPPPGAGFEDDKSELVNRMLGQARIGQGLPSDSGVRPPAPMPEPVSLEEMQQFRNVKTNQKTNQRGKEPSTKKSRARGGQPGIHPAVLILSVLVILGAVAGGGFYAYQQGFIKIDTTPEKVSPKVSVDDHIKNGEFDKAREILEAKQKSSKLSAAELEKLNGVYFSLAGELSQDGNDSQEAVKLLEKIPSKSKKYKDAQKLLRKLKKKVRKNPQ